MDEQSSGFGPIRFSTTAIHHKDRLAQWREVFGASVLRADVTPANGAHFRADVTVHLLPGIAFVSSELSPLRLARTPHLLADGNDDVGLFVSSSAGVVAQRGREEAFGAGDGVVMSASEVSRCDLSTLARYQCLHIRRAALDGLASKFEDKLGALVPAGTAALRYLLSYASLLRDDEIAADARLARSVAIHLRDLFVLALGFGGEAEEEASGRGLRAARLKAIKDDVALRLDEPDLSVGQLARNHGISTRYVQLLFESEGMTFSEYVLEQRLARVRHMLGDPALALRPISALALDAGFGDISHFNRSFRRRYDATPSDIRNRGWPG